MDAVGARACSESTARWTHSSVDAVGVRACSESTARWTHSSVDAVGVRACSGTEKCEVDTQLLGNR